ncbi:MAG: DUF6498-containing protein [Propionibacteriaceae bacterium]
MSTPTTTPPATPLIAMLTTVALNLAMAFGVWKLGWPKGNIFVFFWVENVIVGIFGYVRIVTAKLPSTQGPALSLGKQFAMHYGCFCLVHGLFTLTLAPRMGIALIPMMVFVSVILIALRYLAELMTTWFATKQNLRHSPSDVFYAPYRRIWVLHLGIIAAGFLSLHSLTALPKGHVASFRDPDTTALYATLALIAVKTISDLRNIRADTHGMSSPRN